MDFNTAGKKSCSAFQCLRVGRSRLSVMSFSTSISKSKLSQDHTCTKDNYPQQGSTGMSFVDKKVCYETLSVLSKSIFSWHMNFQHPVLCEITAIFLQAPVNSDELTNGKHMISPLNFLHTCQNNDATEWNLPSSLDVFWRSWCENF